MNAVVYYSNTGESQRIAEYVAAQLNYPAINIRDADRRFDNLALVFPVHCQNVPEVVGEFLKGLETNNITLIATYGKMSCGNVLWEIQRKYKHNVVAAAYVPAKHAYTDEARFSGFETLLPVINKINAPCPITLPKLRKNPFADLWKRTRSQIGVKILKSDACDNCGLCEKSCVNNAIRQGKPDKSCIRCLHCVNVCPKRALSVKITPIMAAYLKKKKQNRLIIYT